MLNSFEASSNWELIQESAVDPDLAREGKNLTDKTEENAGDCLPVAPVSVPVPARYL